MGNLSYFKQADTRVQIYCSEHKDMFRVLKSNILTLYKQYMNSYSVKRLTKIKHLEENGYKFKGVTTDWIDDYTQMKYKVNSLELSEDELSVYMPQQAIFIKSVVYSIYNDLKYITYLYNEGLTELYMNDYVKDVDLVLSSNSKVVEIGYCRKFHSLGLGVPSLLLSEYNKLYNSVVLTIKCIDFYKNIGEDYNSYKDLPIEIIKQMNTLVMNDRIETTDKEMALLAKSFREAYAKCLASGIMIESLLNMTSRKIYKTQAPNGLRLSTVGEIDSRITQLVVEDELLISDEHFNLILSFVYLCTNDEKLLAYNQSLKEDLDDILSDETQELLGKTCDYINSTDFSDDLLTLQTVIPINYPKSALDEIRERGLDEKLKLILSHYSNRSNLNTYEQAAVDIANKGLSGKSLSEKQVKLLNIAYTDISSGKSKENVYTQEVENKIMQCKSYFSYKGNKFFSDLFSNVLKYKRCSSKQLKCIDEEYNKMLEHQKALLESENQYIVKNTRETKADEDRALKELVNNQSNSSSKTKKLKNDEKAEIPTVVFGDYLFEDTDI